LPGEFICFLYGRSLPLLFLASFGEDRLLVSFLRIVGNNPLTERILDNGFAGGGIMSRLLGASICISCGRGESTLWRLRGRS
jgi:hypothetical protein